MSNLQDMINNKSLIKAIKKYFKGVGVSTIREIIKKLVTTQVINFIHLIPDEKHAFYRSNKKKLNIDGTLTHESQEELKNIFIKTSKLLNLSTRELENLGVGDTQYIVNAHTTGVETSKIVCDNLGDVEFIYDFDKPDLKQHYPKFTRSLQRFTIQILSEGFKFTYPVNYYYRCGACDTAATKKAYEMMSLRGAHKCKGWVDQIKPNGEIGRKQCNLKLYPYSEGSEYKDAFYYDISYEDSYDNVVNCGAYSFKSILPGTYDAALLQKGDEFKAEQYEIVDVKKIETNKFYIPKKVANENYLTTFVNALDEYITEKTGMNIYGLNPIKVCLLIQKVITKLDLDRKFNVQMVGDKSTGKTLILKYWGVLLHNNFHLSSAGTNISIPALRGSVDEVLVMGKKIRIGRQGYLGSFKNIHIDEAGENRELVQKLKIFLMEANYSNNMAGSVGIIRKRTAHVNLSENVDIQHMNKYNGQIKNMYNDITDQIEDYEKPEFDYTWDLFQPLHTYSDNPYLKKCIKNIREKYMNNKQWWMDGYDIALHDRFPGYFFIDNTTPFNELDDITIENKSRNIITEILELNTVLKTEEINTYIDTCKSFIKTKDTNYIEVFKKIRKIVIDLGLQTDIRNMEIYYETIELIRAFNQNKTASKIDFELFKSIFSKTNRKITLKELSHNMPIEPEIIIIDNDSRPTSTNDSGFGMPNDEFN